MAYFAKIGLNNEVLAVLAVDNIDTMRPDGTEDEAVGIAFLQKLTGHQTWVKTSINGTERKNYAGLGGAYDSNIDAFVVKRPFLSWSINPKTGEWEAPVAALGGEVEWNEKTKKWNAPPRENDLNVTLASKKARGK